MHVTLTALTDYMVDGTKQHKGRTCHIPLKLTDGTYSFKNDTPPEWWEPNFLRRENAKAITAYIPKLHAVPRSSLKEAPVSKPAATRPPRNPLLDIPKTLKANAESSSQTTSSSSTSKIPRPRSKSPEKKDEKQDKKRDGGSR